MNETNDKTVSTRRGKPRTSDPNDKNMENRRNASARYYAKKSKNQPRIPYSPEVKKQRHRESQARYYAKNRNKILLKARIKRLPKTLKRLNKKLEELS